MIRLLCTSLSLMVAAQAPAAGVNVDRDAHQFSEIWLQKRAAQLAQSDWAPPAAKVPEVLTKLNFDQYHGIRFRPEASVWHENRLPFEMQLFHLGHFYNEPVSIHLVERGRSSTLRYSPNLFTYGSVQFNEPLPGTLGFAGVRVHYPLNRKDYLDELVAFLGASYFRALGRGNTYGLSARGLAIDTAMPSGEIFPIFREFYIEKPAKNATHLVIHALLDSPSTTGAYRFDVFPGENTEIRVTATLFGRRGVERLGLAPLTSMYLFGENDHQSFDDFRPEVHDSDGLLVWFGNGERLWRPLQNPERLETSAFRADSLKGFGLLQRDRHQSHYEDLEAQYERRPSAWIEPTEGFGPGTIFLVEIPSREDIHDNVVAFFSPDQKLTPGKPMRFAYRMCWGMNCGATNSTSSTLATHIGSAGPPGNAGAKPTAEELPRKFVIDFASPNPVTNANEVEAVITVSSGTIKNTRVQPNYVIGGYRAVFDYLPQGPTNSVEMRCFLRQRGAALTETWSYRLLRGREESK